MPAAAQRLDDDDDTQPIVRRRSTQPTDDTQPMVRRRTTQPTVDDTQPMVRRRTTQPHDTTGSIGRRETKEQAYDRETRAAEHQIAWEENDPRCPTNWSVGYRWWLTALVSLCTINATLPSALPSVAVREMSADLGISIEVTELVTSLFLLGCAYAPRDRANLGKTSRDRSYGDRPAKPSAASPSSSAPCCSARYFSSAAHYRTPMRRLCSPQGS